MVRFRTLTHRVLHAIVVSAILTVLKLAGKIADAVTGGRIKNQASHNTNRQFGGERVQSQVFTFNFARCHLPHIDLVGVPIARRGVVVVGQGVLRPPHHHQLGHEVQEELSHQRRHIVRRGGSEPRGDGHRL